VACIGEPEPKVEPEVVAEAKSAEVEPAVEEVSPFK
jgi:hypothetical protein